MVELGPGEFHPRIGGGLLGCFFAPENVEARAQAESQVHLLVRDFLEILQFVEPSTTQLSTFGHKTRNLLILASTEFETQCKGILIANGATSVSSRTTTKDYIKLKDRLHLEEYSFRWVRFPALGEVTPFAGWHSSRPTKSLPWYEAYNETKHDRERHFERATLEAAMAAVAGCIAIVYAQYVGVLVPGEDWLNQGGEIQMVSMPTLLPSERYQMRPNDPGDGSGWTAIQYKFPEGRRSS